MLFRNNIVNYFKYDITSSNAIHFQHFLCYLFGVISLYYGLNKEYTGWNTIIFPGLILLQDWSKFTVILTEQMDYRLKYHVFPALSLFWWEWGSCIPDWTNGLRTGIVRIYTFPALPLLLGWNGILVFWTEQVGSSFWTNGL